MAQTPSRASPSSWACPTGHTQPDDALHPHSATPSSTHLPRSAPPIQSLPPRLHSLSRLGLLAGTVRLLARPSPPAHAHTRPCHRCTTSLTQPRRSALNDRGDPCISRTSSSARGRQACLSFQASLVVFSVEGALKANPRAGSTDV